MTLLAGRTALVTGAAQGIGLAIARMFAHEGASVLLADLNGEGATRAAKELTNAGMVAAAIAIDVRVADQIASAVAKAVADFGRLDIMVNNAGSPLSAPMDEMTEEQFDTVVAVHLRGGWLGIRAAARVMRPQGSGAIINMSSISGKVGIPGQTNYSAAKAGVVGLTKAAAQELGAFGIRVNAILPGTIRTERTANIPTDVWAAKVAEVPLRREGTPDDVAKVALFLASDLSSYVSAAAIEVAGGRYA